jgi:hypothetical protein
MQKRIRQLPHNLKAAALPRPHAFSFVATTKLNCFARNERAFARSIVWSHIIRASPRACAAAAVT